MQRSAVDERIVSEFNAWLSNNVEDVPLCRWGSSQAEVACKFAAWYAKRAVNRTLDVALNSGDGSYRP